MYHTCLYPKRLRSWVFGFVLKIFWCVFYSRGSSIRERLIIARIRYFSPEINQKRYGSHFLGLSNMILFLQIMFYLTYDIKKSQNWKDFSKKLRSYVKYTLIVSSSANFLFIIHMVERMLLFFHLK